MIFLSRFILLITALLFSAASFASESTLEYIALTQHTVSYIALLVFVIAYILVILEEQLHLKKSKPVLLAAGVGGSLLSIVSAAGVALMGQARGSYTFFSHLK